MLIHYSKQSIYDKNKKGWNIYDIISALNILAKSFQFNHLYDFNDKEEQLTQQAANQIIDGAWTFIKLW